MRHSQQVLAVFILTLLSNVGCGSRTEELQFVPAYPTTNREAKVEAEIVQMTDEVLHEAKSNPEIARMVDDIAGLDRFQREYGLSDRIIEAACKESTIRNGGEWVLEEVKRYAFRNQRDGIPFNYLPESEKDRLRGTR